MTGLEDLWIARMDRALHLEDGRDGNLATPGTAAALAVGRQGRTTAAHLPGHDGRERNDLMTPDCRGTWHPAAVLPALRALRLRLGGDQR